MKKSIIISIIAACALVFTIPLILYTINFWGYPISKSSATWGTFGDYLGGITNPIFNIINIILLVYIANTVKTYEETNSANSITAQGKSQLTVLRFEAYKDISVKLDECHQILTKEKLTNEETPTIINMVNYINNFVSNYGFLFPFMEQNEDIITIFNFLTQKVQDNSKYTSSHSESRKPYVVIMRLKKQLQEYITSNLV